MILVYKYGLLAPIQNGDLAREQIRAAHRYQNDLIEVERGRRAAVRAASSTCTDIAALEEREAAAKLCVEKVLDEMRATRSTSRARVETDEQKAALAAAKATLKDARAALKARRQELSADAAYQAELACISEKAGELTRACRAIRRCYQGHGELVEAAVERTRQDTPIYQDPRFRPFTGAGRLGVRPMKARDWDTSTLFAIGPDPMGKSERMKSFRMRVDSDESRRPVWAEWPLVLHRPLPVGVVKQVVVKLEHDVLTRPCGDGLRRPRERWAVIFTVDTAEVHDAKALDTGHTVAVNLGWREMKGGEVRVATWVGTDGDSGTLCIEPREMASWATVADLASIRKKHFTAARDVLASRLDAMPELPEWALRRGARRLKQWESAARLAAFVMQWKREGRFDGDAEAFEAAEAWRFRDWHLALYERGRARHLIAHRNEVYMRFAVDLARRYSAVVIDAVDLASLAERKGKDGLSVRENETARSNRQKAATSELRLALRQAGKKRGRVIVEPPVPLTTKTCAACGSIEEWDQAAEVMHRCGACGVTWDQDENNCRNRLAMTRDEVAEALAKRGARASKTAENGSASDGGRFRRRKAEKLAREKNKEVLANRCASG